MSQVIVKIEGTNLPDLWYQTLYKAIELGRDFTVDTGSFAGQKRKEFDFVVLHSKCPGVGELLPKLNPALQLDDPVAQNYMDNYLPYLMTSAEAEGEAYTYGQRICAATIANPLGLLLDDPINQANGAFDLYDEEINKFANRKPGDYPEFDFDIMEHLEIEDVIPEISYKFEDAEFLFNQMEYMIKTYKNKGYRNNQMIMQVGSPSDMLLKDPPCLRHIDTRIQDGKLHFYPYFRSWDLWGGLPANLGAIELMKQYCAEQIGVENGEIIATSKGLHLYNYVWEIAETVRGRSAEEFKAEMTK